MVKEVHKWAPAQISQCFKKVLRLRYDERPPYEYILNNLEQFFEYELGQREALVQNLQGAASNTDSIETY